MEKFTVILHPDGGRRIIGSHPLLRRLPEKVAQKCLPFMSVQKTGMILDSENHENLGCLIDVPGFFLNWDKLKAENRCRILAGIVRSMKRMDASVLCFPWMHQYLRRDEILFLENEGIILLDGFYHRLAGMLLLVKQLLAIMAADVPYFEIGIWGADTDIGQTWVEAIAGQVNRMCIGGRDLKTLQRLADTMLRTTGLACQVTDIPEVCLSDKNITVLAEPAETSYSKLKPSFHFQTIRNSAVSHSRNGAAADDIHPDYNIELAWMAPPQDVEILQELDPWEELGVLDGLFYAVSRVYREEIRFNIITLEQIKRLHALYELYPVKLLGFIRGSRRIHFDRFRREYFKRRQGIVRIQ
ncbi:MAG: hypothetical protein ACOYEH_08100 [Caldicoprobacterales bacterium]|jgi:hypothetical protein|nr:hypothetical protein [Clostridiales bacterium]